MITEMFFGISPSFGAVEWQRSLLANADRILQFPLLNSALLSGLGRRVLNRAVRGPHGRKPATTTYAQIASVQLLVFDVPLGIVATSPTSNQMPEPE